MKILEINKFHYRRGGADHHFLDLCGILRAKGESVSVFSMLDKRNEPSSYTKYFVSNIEFGAFNFSAMFRPFRVIYSCQAARKLRRLIRDDRPDVAHLHLIYHHLSPSVLSVLKKEKVPVVMTIHDWKPLCPNYLMFTEGSVCERCRGGHYVACTKHLCIHRSLPQSMLGSIEAYIHHAKKYYEQYVDLYIAPSEFVKKMFVKWGFPENKIQVLAPFLPPSITPVNSPFAAPKDLSFAYVGRLVQEKGIMDLVQKWVSEGIVYPLHIFGDGPQFLSIKNLIEKSQAKNIYLYGAVPREKIAEYLRQVTALIVPSEWHEIFGLVVIEALSQGVPVITTQFGSLPGLVEKSGAGLAIDLSGDLAAALKRISGDKYRQRAIEYMALNHRPDDYYRDLMGLFNTVLSLAK